MEENDTESNNDLLDNIKKEEELEALINMEIEEDQSNYFLFFKIFFENLKYKK